MARTLLALISIHILHFCTMQSNAKPIQNLYNRNIQKSILNQVHNFNSLTTPPNTSYVTINYKIINTHTNHIISQANNFTFQLGTSNVICCWDLAIATMKIGEISLIKCDNKHTYGKKYPSVNFEIEMTKWSKLNHIKSISKLSNIYGVTCNDINIYNAKIESNSMRRLSSTDDKNFDYDQWSFYLVCIIIIMNALCLPHACMKYIGQNLKPFDENPNEVYTTKS
eukprot:708557_1